MTASKPSLTPDQDKAVDRLYENETTILVAETGVGKTVIALTAIQELIRDGYVERVIVAAPPKVIAEEIWPKEFMKWDHLTVPVVQITGDARQRGFKLRTTEGVDCVLMISLNNLHWLLQQDHGADGIIIDELSKAAGKQTRGLKSKKTGGCFKWRVGMTATPVSQNFEKFWAMCRVIDGGAALGTNKHNYMMEYFYPDYLGYKWTLKDDSAEKIMSLTASLVHLVSDDKVKTLPPLRERTLYFDLSPETRAKYDEMKKDMIVDDVVAVNQAVKSGKLRQIASGFVYGSGRSRKVEQYSFERLTAVKTWADALEGRPGLIFYTFVEQAKWVAGLPANVTLVQINSMSHGVDGLQHIFADLLFVQPVWSRDQRQQAIGRVWRQGQTKPVTVTTLMARDTLDDVVKERVEGNAQWMELFKQHLKG